MHKGLIAFTTAISLALTATAPAYAQAHANHAAQQSDVKKSTPKQQTTKKQTPSKQASGQQTPKAQTSKQKTASKNNGQRFSQGQKFERSKASNYRVITYSAYPKKLSRPPQGYRWVRSGDDAYLIRISNNVITKVVRGLFG